MSSTDFYQVQNDSWQGERRAAMGSNETGLLLTKQLEKNSFLYLSSTPPVNWKKILSTLLFLQNDGEWHIWKPQQITTHTFFLKFFRSRLHLLFSTWNFFCRSSSHFNKNADYMYTYIKVHIDNIMRKTCNLILQLLIKK